MLSSPTPHGNRSLFLAIFLLLTNLFTVTARPLSLNLPGITATASVAAGTVTDPAGAAAPLYLAPFPNENSTDPNIIPDEYIIALFPDSSYAALDAFMTETYGAPLDADRVDVLVRPGDPPRFDSYLWAHGVSAGWIGEVRTFPGTKRVSRNGYATAGGSETF
ncbi:hypothetical protein PG985_000328 [Apiospora marii]|uniref:Uncharacterized protein n=1 Tax=Apiospora marii TaxID=335849 RepID=A0ABR1R2I6_9PEZI